MQQYIINNARPGRPIRPIPGHLVRGEEISDHTQFMGLDQDREEVEFKRPNLNLPELKPLTWNAEAACLGNPEPFLNLSEPGEAIKICLYNCAVLEQCAQWADTSPEAERTGMVVAGRLPGDGWWGRK